LGGEKYYVYKEKSKKERKWNFRKEIKVLEFRGMRKIKLEF
jgi:hypothetical protein